MKSAQLDTVINQIQQKWGQQAIQTIRHLRSDVQRIRTGFAALDSLIEGIPQGYISQIVGQQTSGASTLLNHLMASAQSSGKHVVHIEFGNHLDSAYAAQCGVNLNDLLLVEVDNSPIILDLVRSIVMSGSVGLLIINLLHVEAIQLDLRRVISDVMKSNCAVLFLSSQAIKSPEISLRLQVKRHRWLRQQDNIVACLSTVQIEKNRFGQTELQTMLLIPFTEGLSV